MNLTKRPEYPWLLVITYSCLGICMPAAVTQFSMLVGTMADIMQVGEKMILLADSLRAVCLVVALFLSGIVYKHFGLRKTMILGLFFQIAPQFLIPLAVRNRDISFFFIAKGMQGLNAVAFPLYLATITTWISARYRGLATAIFNGSFTAGAGIGAWISGLLIPKIGWQMSFYFVGAACLFFAIPVLLITREKEDHNKKDKEKDTKQYRRIIGDKKLWVLVVAFLANTWITQAVTVDMSVYATYLDYSYGQIGNLMLLISIVTVIASILAGGISDFFASRSKDKLKSRVIVLSLGYFIAALAALILPLGGEKGFTFISILASAMMIGTSWAQGVYWAIPSELYETKDHIVVTSICSGASNIVNPIAPIVVGVVLGTRGLWHIGWITCSIMALISLIAVLMIPKYESKQAID
ncbi:MFS transporter [Tissierellaceae bacterium HCP3S3_D8]